MTGFEDVNVGDKVRLTHKEFDYPRVEFIAGGYDADGMLKSDNAMVLVAPLDELWSVEVLEHAPKPLPTEPGWYKCAYGIHLNTGSEWFHYSQDGTERKPHTPEFDHDGLQRLVPESDVDAARKAVEAVRALVMNTDGEYLASEDFDGLAGCIQEALAEHGFLGGTA